MSERPQWLLDALEIGDLPGTSDEVKALEAAFTAGQADVRRNGLVFKGWWCICDIFNGEEKEPRVECRSCGRSKTVRAPRD